MVRLADYIVSYSLQINNRCLRFLAECDVGGVVAGGRDENLSKEDNTVFAESLLARDTRRLVSIWSLMRPALTDDSAQVRNHVEALNEAVINLAEGPDGRRLAFRLAALATDDQVANAMFGIARTLPEGSALTWDALNEMFSFDSEFWRSSNGFRPVEDEVLVDRIVRSYRKSYRLAAAFKTLNSKRSGKKRGSGKWLADHEEKFYKWVQRITHQLELLRPGLSDNGKAQLWYLGKLADTLRMRIGLSSLAVSIGLVGDDGPVPSKREHGQPPSTALERETSVAHHCVIDQMAKMDGRVVRLMEGCFHTKPKRMQVLVDHALQGLAPVGALKLAKQAKPASAMPKTTAAVPTGVQQEQQPNVYGHNKEPKLDGVRSDE